MLEDSVVEIVEADMVEEKDNDAGRFTAGGDTVEARESRCSALGSITYFVTICCGNGCRGGKGGIGKVTTGPNVTCLKYVVK